MTDIEKLIHEIFNKIFREINNSSLNLKDTFDTIAPELRKLTLEINKSGDDGINIVWMNFWSSDFEFVRFSNVSGEFVCDKDKLKDSGISNDINIYSIEKSNYNKYILSSRNLLRKLGVEDEIFALNKNSKDKFNATQFSLKISEDEDKKLKELKELYSSKEIDINNKYKESYRIFSKEENNGIVTVPFLLDLGKDNETKFLNWIFWLYNLYDSETWDYIFYLDGFFSSFGHKEKFITTNDIHCNIGISLNNSELSTILVLIKKLRTLISKLATLNAVYIHKEIILQSQLKTAIISILVDSFSHNISAHSLAALKWWFEQRSKILEKRMHSDGELKLDDLKPKEIKISKEDREKTTEKYYSTLDLTDSTYNADYYSLFDYLQFTKDDKKLFQFATKLKPKTDADENEEFSPQFPVSLDYAIYPFMRFLRDKGAFWSGVTRDVTYGGESKTLYEILWEDFANNPLYLGTIAHSEGVTKLNLYLSFEDNNGKKTKSGRFVTIDLSLIEFESEIANSVKNTSQSNASSNIDQSKQENCNSHDSFIPYEKYSRFALIRLGECFSYFREILKKDEYKVFLPGGVVGEHALFTIIENTIRNIKHLSTENLEKIKMNGLDLYISINKGKEEIGNTWKLDSKSKLRLGIWLNHSTVLKTKTPNEKGELVEKRIVDLMKQKSECSIVDDSGVPRMGGNSQDKACAAMLFTNKFTSVEDNKNDYYPWIEFIDKPDNEEGVLKKYFHIWRSEGVFTLKQEHINDIKKLNEELNRENISRFKFVIYRGKIPEEVKKELRRRGIIRILDNIKEDKVNTSEIYKKWLESWCKLKFGDKKTFLWFNAVDTPEDEGNEKTKGALFFYKGKLIFKDGLPKNLEWNDHKIQLSHGKEKPLHCNIRSHGAFRQKFFHKDITELSSLTINADKDLNGLQNKILEEKIENNNNLLLEFLEVVKTKVAIYDNRVNERFKIYPVKKMEMFKKQLNLTICEENQEKFEVNNNIEYNICIMHLSFIEKIKDKNGEKYSEERIVEFIEEKILKDKKRLPNDFIFIITSGRGRDKWKASVEKDGRFIPNIMFKPIETILNSIEIGISYNDHFEIKYNLIKSLFGS